MPFNCSTNTQHLFHQIQLVIKALVVSVLKPVPYLNSQWNNVDTSQPIV